MTKSSNTEDQHMSQRENYSNTTEGIPLLQMIAEIIDHWNKSTDRWYDGRNMLQRANVSFTNKRYCEVSLLRLKGLI